MSFFGPLHSLDGQAIITQQGGGGGEGLVRFIGFLSRTARTAVPQEGLASLLSQPSS